MMHGWFLACQPDRTIALRSQKWKGNMLLNTLLKRNGPQSPMSDDDMNYSCVKSVKTAKIIYNNNNNKPLFQIPRPLRQTIMVYCGINLQTSKTLRNTNQFLNGSKIGQSRSIADWLAFNFVDFLLFRALPETSKCAVFWGQITDDGASRGFW